MKDGRIEIESTRTVVHIETTSRLENGRIILGARSTEYFPSGRSEVTERDHMAIAWTDGSPITEKDRAKYNFR